MLALPVLSIVGCSLLVDADLPQVHCEDEGAVGAPACPADARCVRGLCVEAKPGRGRMGAHCGANADCGAEELCLPLADGSDVSICSRPCCASSDCDDPAFSMVCASLGPKSVGRFCVPSAAMGRLLVGTGLPGSSCEDDATCRSGSCVKGICADACCSDTNCAVGSAHGVCRLGSSATLETWVCDQEPTVPLASYLDPCAQDGDCASGLCLPMFGKLRCSKPCCESEGCGSLPEGLVGCDDYAHGGLLVRACAKELPVTALASVGVECTWNEQCRSGLCLPSNGHRACSDLCCTDAHCGDRAFACRPAPMGPTSALRCERK